jgi:hypothetical protein
LRLLTFFTERCGFAGHLEIFSMFGSRSSLIGLVAFVVTALTSPCSTLQAAAEPGRDISGFVVDERGRPVASADVTYVWRANGPDKDENGKRSEDDRVFWGNVGKMFPLGEAPARTGMDGRFLLGVPHQFHALMALDSSRQHGGLVILPPGREKTEVNIALGPLVRLRGTMEGPNAGNRPVWTHVYTELPVDPERPLDMTVLVSCGSFQEARFQWIAQVKRKVRDDGSLRIISSQSLEEPQQLIIRPVAQGRTGPPGIRRSNGGIAEPPMLARANCEATRVSSETRRTAGTVFQGGT